MPSFQISGLPEQGFAAFFALDTTQLASLNMQRVIADANPGYPCRVSLVDAEVGEELLLLPFEHQTGESPYRASGPIFVRRGARRSAPAVGEIPAYVGSRLISLRAYDATHGMVHAEVCEGSMLAPRIALAFADARVAYLHLHNAKRGCYFCRVDRAND